MSVINPNETSRSWHAHRPEAAVQLYLAAAEGDAAMLVGTRVAGFPLNLSVLSTTDSIATDELSSAAAAIIQVDADVTASIKRFEQAAASTATPLIAAVYDPPLALVRSLLRAGAHDVMPLPLDLEELETSLAPVRDMIVRRSKAAELRRSKLVTVIKSVGGVGATALLTQLAVQFAQNEAEAGREVCLIDLDVQFGDAGFQLGLRSSLSVADLIDAGSRLDGDLLRSTTAEHPSGLKVITSPPEVIPLESLTSEQVIEIIERAQLEFGTVFVDLPANWTNWSLSLLARSDFVLLVTELSVASLNQARRQLDLIAAQELGEIELRVVVNRFEKGLLKTIKPADVEHTLGREVAYTVSNDPVVVRTAIDQGIPLSEVKRKSAAGKDIAALEAALAAALGLER